MNHTVIQNDAIIYFEGNRPGQTLLPAIKALLARPADFFAGMPFAVFYGNSIFLASIIIFILTFLAAPFYSLGVLFMLPATWGIVLIGMWVLAAYMRRAVKVAGGHLTTANAFQLSAYAFTPMMLAGLSWLGAVAFGWSMYLLWQGLVTYCRLKSGHAVAVMAVPLLAASIIGGGIMFILSHISFHN